MQEIRSFIRARRPVNLMIVLVNVVVFIVLSILGSTKDPYFMVEHGAQVTSLVAEEGEYYRLLTSMFLHSGVEHLFYNMLLLLFLGDTLEKAAGKVKYLFIYLGGGIVGNLVSVWFDLQAGQEAISAGASGAIFAVVGALIWIVIRNKGELEDYSIERLFLMAGLTVAQGFMSTGIDNCAHVGGLVTGFLIAVVLYRGDAEGRAGKESQ